MRQALMATLVIALMAGFAAAQVAVTDNDGKTMTVLAEPAKPGAVAGKAPAQADLPAAKDADDGCGDCGDCGGCQGKPGGQVMIMRLDGQPTTQPSYVFRPGQGNCMFAVPGARMEMVKAPYLGIMAAPADATLRKQIGLAAGVGLVIDHLDPEGPARKAGVEQHDVLWKLDDQLVINTQQLVVLVRTFKVGGEVKLTVIRAAKPQVIAVKLGEKDQPSLEALSGPCVIGMPEREPLPPGPAMDAAGKAAPGVRVMPPGRMIHGGAVAGGGRGECTVSDGKMTVKLTTDLAGNRWLHATDKDGNVLFDGAIDTAEQRKAVPEDILRLVEGIKIRMAPANPPVPGQGPDNQPPGM